MNVPMFTDLVQRRELGKKRRERNRRRAVGSFDQCRDALSDVVVRSWNLEDAARGVRMDVDEPRRDHLAIDVDRCCR